MGDLLTLQNLITVVIAVVVTCPAAYALGWAWSRGYHRGKREFVARMVQDACGKDDV